MKVSLSNFSNILLTNNNLTGPITAHDLETDPFLGLHEEEPDSWSPTVGKEVESSTISYKLGG
jgi:hypothetical protein